jgi:hypothetical protein
MMNHQTLSSFIWSVADLLRSPSSSADAQWPSVNSEKPVDSFLLVAGGWVIAALSARPQRR